MDLAFSLGYLKIVNLRLSGLYLFNRQMGGATMPSIGDGLGDMGDDRTETVVMGECGR